MDRDFKVSTASKHRVSPAARMLCQGKECHCYGKICLVSDLGKGNCSAGNIFVNGRAFCGLKISKNFGKTVCKELGFKDIKKVTVNE